jgi:hypothetical protein
LKAGEQPAFFLCVNEQIEFKPHSLVANNPKVTDHQLATTALKWSDFNREVGLSTQRLVRELIVDVTRTLEFKHCGAWGSVCSGKVWP